MMRYNFIWFHLAFSIASSAALIMGSGKLLSFSEGASAQTPPLECFGQPEDIGNVVPFLAGSDGGGEIKKHQIGYVRGY